MRSKTLMIIAATAICCAAVLLTSCGSRQKIAKTDIWKLTSTSISNEYGTYLGNGSISTEIKGDGIGSQNGQPLACYMAGLYVNEKLAAMPTWSDLAFYDGKTRFSIDDASPYKQVLDMKSGILTTEATWKAGNKSFTGKIEIIVCRDKANAGLISAQITPDFDGSISVTQNLSNPSGFKTLAPISGKANAVYEISGTSRGKDLACAMLAAADGKEINTFSPIQFPVSKGKKSGYASLVIWGRGNSIDEAISRIEPVRQAWNGSPAADRVKVFTDAHKAAWAHIWESDIVVKGDPKTQQSLHSCMFYLLQSVREDSDNSIPPMGLSSAAFTGHIFWDADIWMFPALLLQHPDFARSIVNYRARTITGAMKNASTAGMKGAQFAWESGESGIEDVPASTQYANERHINSDVALAQWQYYLATADKVWLKTCGYPVLKATADYWVSRAKLVNGRYEILQVIPPDENAGLVNNSAYTNAGARLNLLIAAKSAGIVGLPANPQWTKVANGLYIPFDKTGQKFIARDGYTAQNIKQADPELIIYPLQYVPEGMDEAAVFKNTYKFYEPRVNKNGPAMSSSVHSLISARLGDSSSALKKLQDSYKPFLRGSFNYFNEKRSKTYKNTCFLTGASGPVQALIYGFAGARMDYLSPDADTKPLEFKPCIPKKWKSLEIKGIHWQGKVFNVLVDNSGKVTQTPIAGH